MVIASPAGVVGAVAEPEGSVAPAAGAEVRPAAPAVPGVARMRVARVPEAEVARVVARARGRAAEEVVADAQVVDEGRVSEREREMLAALERVQASPPTEVARMVDFDVPPEETPDASEVGEDDDDQDSPRSPKRPEPVADVDALYDRIAARLRRELMDDHERRGSLRPPW